MRSALAAVLFLSMGSTAAPTSQTSAEIPTAHLEAIETYIAERYPDDGTGLSVLISVNGQEQFVINRGMANLEWNMPNDTDVAYRLGSISKPLTAIALLSMEEQGNIDLGAPVGTYISDLPPHMARVTVIQLMSHTSGLADHAFNDELLPFIRSGMTVPQVIDMQRDVPANFEPGAQYEYSNFNYTLLGYLIEVVSGMPYSDYMEQTVFAAHGMAYSASDDRREIVPHRAQNYTVEDGIFLHAENVDMSHVGAAGQLLSSPADLAHWFDLLMNDALVSAASRERAWTAVTPTNGEPGGYGLGFNVSERNGRRFIWHTGLTPGAHGAVGTYPDEGIVIVILGNGFHLPSTGAAMRWMADEVVGAAHD
jgi:CubicO group peptidase (beta-lactamase class C family)